MASKYFLSTIQELQKNGVEKVCVLSLDSSFPRSVAIGTIDQAKSLNVAVNDEPYYHAAGGTSVLLNHLLLSISKSSQG